MKVLNKGKRVVSNKEARMVEAKIFAYDVKGNYLWHQFMTISTASNVGENLNKKPYKVIDDESKQVEFRYLTDDLNTSTEYAADKWIKEPHRLYFYVLDPTKHEVEMEFTKNMEGFVEKMLVSRKLRNYRCSHKYSNQDNYMFKFGGYGDSIFDKIYYVTDEEDINIAKEVFHDMLVGHVQEIRTELDFYNDMISKVDRKDVVIKEVNPEDFIAGIDSDEKDILDHHTEETIIVEKEGLFKRLFRSLVPSRA